ncbi:MAG: type III-B CRISPR module RAMP protein Cmr6 [Kiritimatiellae bacterium]|nr:type III-B CRISPR module RAMP protein Cmr6 [Kiritimatiellia bacterium]
MNRPGPEERKMPFLSTDEIKKLLADGQECESRSLMFDRFCDPRAKEDDRKAALLFAMGKKPCKQKAKSWAEFLSQANAFKLEVKLQSRMMVNMAGGVMENAGLCIDRFGVPYIPGSAVKGCARRAALAALREWCETGQKPAGDHPLARCCEDFETQQRMLENVALVFGWTELEWSEEKKDGEYKSDYVWATDVGGRRDEILNAVVFALLRRQGETNDSGSWQQARTRLRNYAGSVSFLPAYPIRSPTTDLELDVVTCHHRNYYKREKDVATDDEEPNPVVFPAVAPGHEFVFALVTSRGSDAFLLDCARRWLQSGLETFGIGAKTAAGYGWFQVQTADHQQTTERSGDATSDYNEQTFGNRVLRRLQKLGELAQLQGEIETLRKPENQKWLDQLQRYLCSADGRNARQWLRNKQWFPQEWLPPQPPAR